MSSFQVNYVIAEYPFYYSYKIFSYYNRQKKKRKKRVSIDSKLKLKIQ